MISVIVPVYNAGKYLHRCIDSILRQTYPDFELLLIDDGSKDNSGPICDESAQKDSRVRVFHQENKGVIAARSVGIRNAKGDYIYFVDADDSILPDTLNTMLPYMTPEVDVVIFESKDDCVYSNVEYANALLKFNYWVVWGKLFRRELFDDFVMDIPRYFRVGEDFLTNLKLLKNLHGHVVCKSINKYIYNVNNPYSVQVTMKFDYEYEKNIVIAVDDIVKGLPFYADIYRNVIAWKLVYLGGMIGLCYNVDYKDCWIVSLLEEVKDLPLTIKERVIVASVKRKILRVILISEKKLKNFIRRIMIVICKGSNRCAH